MGVGVEGVELRQGAAVERREGKMRNAQQHRWQRRRKRQQQTGAGKSFDVFWKATGVVSGAVRCGAAGYGAVCNKYMEYAEFARERSTGPF